MTSKDNRVTNRRAHFTIKQAVETMTATADIGRGDHHPTIAIVVKYKVCQGDAQLGLGMELGSAEGPECVRGLGISICCGNTIHTIIQYKQ